MTNAELIEALQTDIREVEDDPVKTLSLMWRAADALEAAEKRIKELETRLPKEGEWINPSRNPDFVNKDFFSDCSICGYTSMDESDYCPNCGARMKKGEENDKQRTDL